MPNRPKAPLGSLEPSRRQRPHNAGGNMSPDEFTNLKMPDPVICTECGKEIEDVAAAVETTPYGTDTRQFAHAPIPGCPTDEP